MYQKLACLLLFPMVSGFTLTPSDIERTILSDVTRLTTLPTKTSLLPRTSRASSIKLNMGTTLAETEEEKETEAVVDASQNDTENPIQEFVHRFLAAGGGDIGERGEVYFFAQALPIIGIALGGLPFISDALRLAAGPGLLLLGFVVMAVTALDMGGALTPWPKPNGDGLVTTGLYGQVRHPMYAGLLSSMLGFSVWTQSVDRLLMVALLVAAIEIKSEYEENELAKAYPDYPEYKKQVTGKFIPQSLLNLLQKKDD